MIRGSTKIFLETVAAIVVLAVVLAGFVAWRLTQGPISVDAVTRYIESALSDPAGGRRVTIGSSGIIWDPDEHAVDVRADRVTVFDADGQAVMIVPEMIVRFRLAALLRGVVAPRSIAFIRPALTVIRSAEGEWELSAVPDSDQGPPAARSGDIEQIRALVERSLSQLDRFRLVDARLVIDDRRAHALWLVPRLSVALQRGRTQFDAAASIELDLDGKTVPIRAGARLDPAYNLIDADVTIADFVPAKIAGQLEALNQLAPLDLPLGGTIRYGATAANSGRAVQIDLSGGAGQIVTPMFPDGHLPVTTLTLRGRYEFTGERMMLDQLVVGLPSASITLSGTAQDLSGTPTMEGTIAVPSLPVDDLRRYWPPELATNVRRWILANITQGAIKEAAVRFTGHGMGAAFDVDQIDGQMAVEGTRVRYLRPQPPVEQVEGQVRFDTRHFDIAVHGGRLRGLKVESAQLTITGLEKPDQLMAMQVAVSGPVTDALVLLDLPPFGYIKRFGMSPQSITGDMTAQLALKFPLVDRLTFDDVTLNTTAVIDQLRVPKAVRDLDLTAGHFDLNLDKAGLGLIGQAEIGGVPAAVSWDEHFERGGPFRRRYQASATVSDAQRRALGLALADYVAGPVGLAATYTEQIDQRSTLSGTLDFRAAELKVDALGWIKPAGQPATARIDAGLTDGRLATLERAELSGGGLVARTSGAFDAQGNLARLDIHELKTGATDVAGRATWSGDRLDVALTGRSLDASPLFGGDDVGGKPPRAMTVSAKLDRVRVGPGRELGQVALAADSDGVRWRSASISAGTGTGTMTLRLTPGARGRALAVVADDAGAVLRIFGITDGMQGGRLRVEGTYDDARATDWLNAQVTVEDYRFLHVPVLGKLLAAVSITGLPDAMSGDGIGFKEMAIKLVKTPSRIEIVDGRASGLALGLTLQGTIEGRDDVADLTGTIVPVNQVNSLFEAIPLIGDIVTGKGGGLFAFTYAVKGPLDNPEISVNPLSVLAPGFVRNLFRWLPTLKPDMKGEPPPMSNKQ